MYSNKNYKELIKAVDDFVTLHGYETYDLVILYSVDDEKSNMMYAIWQEDSYQFIKRPKELYEDVDITIIGIMIPEQHQLDYIWEGGEKWKKREDEESL